MSEPNFENYIENYKGNKNIEQLAEEAERAEADRVYFREVEPRLEDRVSKTKKETKKNEILENYNRLYETARKYGVNVENTFADTSIKRKHLVEIMGYSELKSRGRKISIEKASDARIGMTYRNCYNEARKKYNK